MMQKIQLCITGINYILKYIKIENSYFKLKKILKQIYQPQMFEWQCIVLGLVPNEFVKK